VKFLLFLLMQGKNKEQKKDNQRQSKEKMEFEEDGMTSCYHRVN